MKTGWLLAGALALAACGTAEGDLGPTASASALEGGWLSSGSDMAKGFGGPPLNFVSLTAAFQPDSSYTVEARDSGGKTIQFAGTFTSTPSTVPGVFEIEQRQSAPQAVVSRGIYQLDQATGRMTLEVIQVQPDVGATPPTAAAGFGSTTVKGKATDAWIQKFARQ